MSIEDSRSRRRRVIGKAEWARGEANPRFVVTSLKADAWRAKPLYEKLYCARGEMENRIKECQGDLFADRTSTATMRANQLRLWFASMAYVLICALRRIGLAHTPLANATCGTIRLKLLKLGALVKITARRVKIAFASACPSADEWRLAAARLPCPRLAGDTRRARPSAETQATESLTELPAHPAQRKAASIRNAQNRQTNASLNDGVRNAG